MEETKKPESTWWDTAALASLSHQKPEQPSRLGDRDGLHASLALLREGAAQASEEAVGQAICLCSVQVCLS